MDYLIRTCTPADVPAVVVLCARHAAYEHAGYQAEGKEALLQQVLFGAAPRLFCLVVEVDQQVKGYASYTFDCATWDAAVFMYLDCLYLQPECRGHRIGEMLMQQLAAIARDNHCTRMEWQTPDFNTNAIRFYERIGGVGRDKRRFSLRV